MHEILVKFIKGKVNLYLILSSQRVFFNKPDLGYKPNGSFSNIFHARKKPNCPSFKSNFYNKLGNLDPYCYSKLNDLRWYKGNKYRLFKVTITLDLKIFG